jgi:DNA modification methylase
VLTPISRNTCTTPAKSINKIRKGNGVTNKAPFGGKKYVGKKDISSIYSGKAWNPDEHVDKITGLPLRRMRDVWSINTKGYKLNQEHFSSYPVALCEIPISATCPPGGVVLDPFCGTGTTGVAALLLGRRFIGIEIFDKYLPVAEYRLQNYELERKKKKKVL